MKRFALAGNPNSGKTTLFNSLTGSTAHVGNWPGVTVDKKEGVYKKCAEPISIIDLPGIYSLSPYTPEEVVARNYIIDEKPDCVINIVDATNLERNLYLTTQIMEIDVPVIIALNMMDAVEKAGDKIDEQELEKRLGLPVVKISALKESGLDQLMQRGYEASLQNRKGITVLNDSALGHLIGDITIALRGQGVKDPLFHAVKLAEGDELEVKNHKETVGMIEAFKKTFADDTFGEDFEAIVADGRYKYITKHYSPVLVRKNKNQFECTTSEKADRVLTHKIWGIPIFLLILFGIFHLTFSEDLLYLGKIFSMPTLEDLGLIVDGEYKNYGVKLLATFYDGAIMSPGVWLNNLWNDIIVGHIFGTIQGWIASSGLSSWAVGLINNGMIDGITAVLSFLPWILVLFLFFSILEDTGYMARIAFILDKLLRKFGLSGRAFLPMIMGFGCSVPAMINTRTLADDNERTATIRVIPFFVCGAKLPILTAIAGGIVTCFGVGNSDLITYGMYLLGVVTALITVIILRGTTLKGETPPFIMELPSYHAPQFKNLMLHIWDKAKHFLIKAFTVILASTIVVWVVSHFSFSWQFLSDSEVDQSILAGFGRLIQPIFTPLGFGSQLNNLGWVFIVSCLTGLIAKENVIATFGTLGACILGSTLDVESDGGVSAAVAMINATGISISGLLAFIAFNITTIPCFAAVATAKSELKENGKFKGTLFFWLITSYICGTILYTVGSWWWTVFIWLAVIITALMIIRLKNKGKSK